MFLETLFTIYSLINPVTLINKVTGENIPVASKIEPGVYQHYKGAYYSVLFVSMNSETLKEEVVYQALYGDLRIWSRPIEMFLEDIKVNNISQPRFKHIAGASDAKKYINIK